MRDAFIYFAPATFLVFVLAWAYGYVDELAIVTVLVAIALTRLSLIRRSR